jgi:hypothetical protein
MGTKTVIIANDDIVLDPDQLYQATGGLTGSC